MKHPFEQRIAALLERRASNNTLRHLPAPANTSQKVDFASNDYLGLSLDPILETSTANLDDFLLQKSPKKAQQARVC